MTWLKRALPAVALAWVLATPSHAQIGGQPVEVSAGGGVLKYDIRARVETGPSLVGSIGWRARPFLTLEGTALFGPSQADTNPHQDHDHMFLGADLRWNLKPAYDRVVPFLLTGMSYGSTTTTGHDVEKLERGSPSLGMGVLVSVLNHRTYLRLQLRDQMFRERDAQEFSNHFAATAGIQYSFFGRVRDQDLDGVRDWLDKCPNSPIGSKVTPDGCPTDADADSVVDGIDTCPDTRAGCRVDAKGCPIDRDGDGVCDGIDTCPDTPAGCAVDSSGCSADADADSVCDGIDTCPNTPRGCPVNAQGCTIDTDGDGVCDALDQCPNTPTGAAVGPNGCPTQIGALEQQLMTGMVRLTGVVFGTERSRIESSATLDELGLVLQQTPSLRIEIGGPTDVSGKQAERERLSLEQARAVLDYLKEHYPLISTSQYTLRGFAVPPEGLPPVPEKERMKGRRIEFKVLNADQLDREREVRGLPKR